MYTNVIANKRLFGFTFLYILHIFFESSSVLEAIVCAHLVEKLLWLVCVSVSFSLIYKKIHDSTCGWARHSKLGSMCVCVREISDETHTTHSYDSCSSSEWHFIYIKLCSGNRRYMSERAFYGATDKCSYISNKVYDGAYDKSRINMAAFIYYMSLRLNIHFFLL